MKLFDLIETIFADKRGERSTPPPSVAAEDEHLKNESAFRKQATSLKKQKRYDEAVRFLRLAREEQYKTDFQYDMQTLLRVPKCLMLAGRYEEAVLELKDLLAGKWITNAGSWLSRDVFDRQMVLDVLLESAQKTGDEVLVRYCQEESARFEDDIVRARVYEARRECRKLVNGKEHDLVDIFCHCAPTDPCFVWHRRIISAFGKTAGFPTLDDIDAKVLFGGESDPIIGCVNECIDADEIELFKAHPLRDFSLQSLRQNKYEIDVDRFVRRGKSHSAAVVAVARERIEIAIRSGLICEESQEVVDALSDIQVLKLCPDGMPPVFEPFKATKMEIANGARESYENGVLTISRSGISASRIIEIFES